MSATKSIKDLSDNAEFFNVNGVPVAIDDLEAYRFDSDPAEFFPLTSVQNDGVEISKADFMLLVAPPA